MSLNPGLPYRGKAMLCGHSHRPYLSLTKGQMCAEVWTELRQSKDRGVHMESARPFMVQGGASGQREESRMGAGATSPLPMPLDMRGLHSHLIFQVVMKAYLSRWEE